MSQIHRPALACETAAKLVPMIVHFGPSLREHDAGCPHEDCENCAASRHSHLDGAACMNPHAECECGAWYENRFYFLAVALVAHVLGEPAPLEQW